MIGTNQHDQVGFPVNMFYLDVKKCLWHLTGCLDHEIYFSQKPIPRLGELQVTTEFLNILMSLETEIVYYLEKGIGGHSAYLTGLITSSGYRQALAELRGINGCNRAQL